MPARHVFLHAGLPKTGTSAIQATLAHNRERLERFGVRYWGIGVEHNTALSQLEEESGGRKREARARRRSVRPDAVRQDLREELARATDRFVISAESLSAAHAPLAGLVDLVTAGGADCTAIIYIREPRSALTSAVQQRLKTGHSIAQTLARKADDHPQRRVDGLLSVLDRERLVARGYPGRDLLPDFLRVLGLTPSEAAAVEVVGANEALTHEAALWLDAINTITTRDDTPGQPNRLARLLSAQFPGPRFQLPPDVLDAHVNGNAAAWAFLSELIGQDILALPSSVAPQPHVPPPDPRLVEVIAQLAAGIRQDRGLLRDRPERLKSSRRGSAEPAKADDQTSPDSVA